MVTTESSIAVAQVIAQQIGHRAFFMMGTRNRVGSAKDLSFDIRGCKKISHIRVELAVDDTYTVTFIKVRSGVRRFDAPLTVSRHDGVYADGLKSLIEAQTGLALSL